MEISEVIIGVLIGSVASLIITFLQNYFKKNENKFENAYSLKLEAYSNYWKAVGLLAAGKENEVAYWKARCELIGNDEIRRWIENYHHAPHSERQADAYEALIKSMRGDLTRYL